jgi:hypothetical protein
MERIDAAQKAHVIVLKPIFGPGSKGTRESLNFTQKIFARAGITVISREPASVNDPDLRDFWSRNASSVLRRYAVAPDEVPVLYVSSLDGGQASGMAFCEPVPPSPESRCVIVVAGNRPHDTLAHELAHILCRFEAVWKPRRGDEQHSADKRNLLANGDYRLSPNDLSQIGSQPWHVDQVTPEQCAMMREHPLLTSVETLELSGAILDPGGSLGRFPAPLPGIAGGLALVRNFRRIFEVPAMFPRQFSPMLQIRNYLR